MRDWFHVSAPITVLDEKALIVLEPVWCSDYGVVEPVRVKVLDSLADALLEVSGRHDLQIFAQPEPCLFLRALRRFDDELEVIDAPFETTADHNLAFPIDAVVGKHLRDRLVAPPITTDGL